MRVRLRAVHRRDDTREERVRNGLARVKGRERSSQDGAKSDRLVFARGRTPIRSFCLFHNRAPWAQSCTSPASRHSRLINARFRSHLNRRNVLSAGDEVASNDKSAFIASYIDSYEFIRRDLERKTLLYFLHSTSYSFNIDTLHSCITVSYLYSQS